MRHLGMPLKVMIPLTSTFPVSDGPAFRTTLPVPVLVVVPVPPLATASVPVETLAALKDVREAPLPAKLVARTLPATWSFSVGAAVPRG